MNVEFPFEKTAVRSSSILLVTFPFEEKIIEKSVGPFIQFKYASAVNAKVSLKSVKKMTKGINFNNDIHLMQIKLLEIVRLKKGFSFVIYYI